MADIHCDNTNGNDSTGDGSAGNPYQSLQKCVDVAAGGDTIWVGDSSAQTLSAAITWNTGWSGGTADDTYLTIRGWDYSAGAGVGAEAEIDCTSVACWDSATSRPAWVCLRELHVHDATQDNITLAEGWILYRCRSIGAGRYGVQINFANSSKVVACRVTGAATTAINISNSVPPHVSYCWVEGEIEIVADDAQIIGNVLIPNAGGIALDFSSVQEAAIIGNTFVGDGSASQIGIDTTSFGYGYVVANNIFTGFSGAGALAIDTGGFGGLTLLGNTFYDNTTDVSGNAAALEAEGSTTDPSFVDAAGGDYTPQNFATGLPGTFLGSNTDSQRVIGAVQRAEGGGSSATPNVGIRTGGQL